MEPCLHNVVFLKWHRNPCIFGNSFVMVPVPLKLCLSIHCSFSQMAHLCHLSFVMVSVPFKLRLCSFSICSYSMCIFTQMINKGIQLKYMHGFLCHLGRSGDQIWHQTYIPWWNRWVLAQRWSSPLLHLGGDYCSRDSSVWQVGGWEECCAFGSAGVKIIAIVLHGEGY